LIISHTHRYIFTIVRNPYDRATSGHFAVTWDAQAPTQEELAGTLFDFFAGTDAEAVVWAHAAEDFAAFGYWRFTWALPENAPDALWIARSS
jgi:hypothetical protein